jgi:hypothetical protein
MHILYRFHGWLIFARVIALFMFVWPYVRSHILCMQLVICLLSWPIKIPNMNKMRQKTSYVHQMCERTYGQTNMKRAITLTKINHPWNRHNMYMLRSWPTKIPNSAYYTDFTNGWFCERYSPFHVCLSICQFAHLVYATSLLSHFIHITIHEIGTICTCSDHGQPRYQIWIKSNKRLVMYTRFRDGWTGHLSFVAFFSYLVSWLAMICACAYYTDFTNGWFCERYSPFHVCLSICQFAHIMANQDTKYE